MATNEATGTAPVQGQLVAYLRGRVRARRVSTRQGSRGFATVLALPAADQYSMPQAVEVWSTDALGEVGADVSVKVRIGGYPRSYDVKREDDDGSVRKVTVQTADNTLTVIG